MGLIYLIQPAELVGTNRYKIGCTAKNTLERILSYKKGTRILHISNSNDYSKVEKILIEKFTKNFKLIAGREYFEGNEIDIYKLFSEIVYQNSIDFTKLPPTREWCVEQVLLMREKYEENEIDMKKFKETISKLEEELKLLKK
jgi:hypothetical protein